jgi:hypothetical protein
MLIGLTFHKYVLNKVTVQDLVANALLFQWASRLHMIGYMFKAMDLFINLIKCDVFSYGRTSRLLGKLNLSYDILYSTLLIISDLVADIVDHLSYVKELTEVYQVFARELLE